MMARHIEGLFNLDLSSLRAMRIDGFLIDQADLGAGSIAEVLGVPFINLSFFPPVYFHDDNPPFTMLWHRDLEERSRKCIRTSNKLIEKALCPLVEKINAFRLANRLQLADSLNDLFSTRAIMTQMPIELELPSLSMPEHVYYTAPFDNHSNRKNLDFPWHRIDDRPLVYVSFGTVRNEAIAPIEIICEALSELPLQTVVSLGGTKLVPDDLPRLAGDPIVVHYAPQISLLSRAVLAITHGGMNTCLEALQCGVPMIAVPIADDQPGVSGRVLKHGVGRVIRYDRLKSSRVRRTIVEMLQNPTFTETAKRFQVAMAQKGGTWMASDIVKSRLLDC